MPSGLTQADRDHAILAGFNIARVPSTSELGTPWPLAGIVHPNLT
ncbi:MAG: hypothetical protein JWQ77_1393, partial [Jatrophihabitans sp.]|nr:hypothetical protein [Jatrophihabitans sp.]